MSEPIVVIRAADERTLPLCRTLLEQQVPPHRIHTVREQPFEAALRACYRLGLESSAEWMITVDADVLPRAGAVQALLDVALSMPPDVVQVEGLVHDRLAGGLRKAGHRAYRTSILSTALPLIPANGTTIRPEFSTLSALAERGHRSHECQVFFGVHDHEQYFRDVYRTSFVHGQKHTAWLADIVPTWRDAMSSDDDLRMALRGFCDGVQSLQSARIDVRDFHESSARALIDLGLSEKQPLVDDGINMARVTALHASFAALADAARADAVRAARSTRQRLFANYRRFGLRRYLIHVAGGILLSIGARLRQDGDVS